MNEPRTSLSESVPAHPDPDELYDAFAGWAHERGFTLYPTQEDALIEIVSGSNVILSTPTGSGKSLVAIGAHFAALARGTRTYYTAPIKALVSEKFFALTEVFGPDAVGMMTGDSTVNADAPIICATAEILANIALRRGSQAGIGQVVADEFHFYSEPERGWAWQVPLLELTGAQFLLMSATLGDVSFFEKDLADRTGRSTVAVSSVDRPVPLTYRYAMTPLHETVEELLSGGQAPVYVVHFSQASAAERAQALTSINVCSKEEKAAIAEQIGGFRFAAGFGKTLSRLVRHGIGVHHAGMLPKYRRLVEQLAQAGLLKVICGTDTLGVGINVPIRTVLFSGLTKFDGTRQRHLKAREFHQIAGRAGRAGYDSDGYVVVQAPEHVIENAKALAKAGDDPKKKRKITRKKAPDGFVNWTESTYERLISQEPEPLTSSFTVSHAMLLNTIARPGDAFQAMRGLLEGNHESRAQQRKHILRAISIYRALRAAGVVEQLEEPDEHGRTVRLTVDLQFDFALNQPLSPFALAAIELLDAGAPSYALDVVSIIESTVDDPRQILSRQQSQARGALVAELKADGVEYAERMELLEDVTYPKPLEELLEAAFATYRSGHPWVADHEPSPKSIVRDMYERAMNFTDYVRYYSIARSEGSLLRYLSDVYDALRHTVPDDAKTEQLIDLIEWLGELVRQVDSSLIDEWEALRHPGTDQSNDPDASRRPDKPSVVTGNERAFRVLVRNEMFRRVALAARGDYATLGELDGESGWDGAAWEHALEEYFAEYEWIGTGADARGPALLNIEAEPGLWRVRQTLDDPEGNRDWAITADVDLAASDEVGHAVIRVVDVGEL